MGNETTIRQNVLVTNTFQNKVIYKWSNKKMAYKYFTLYTYIAIKFLMDYECFVLRAASVR